MLNFRDRTRSGVFMVIWPLAINNFFFLHVSFLFTYLCFFTISKFDSDDGCAGSRILQKKKSKLVSNEVVNLAAVIAIVINVKRYKSELISWAATHALFTDAIPLLNDV